MASQAKTLLLIEDEDGLRLGIADFFEDAGYKVFSAPDGTTGLELARAHKPHIMILDLGLPDMDGNQVLEHIRSRGETLPVLILTARTSEIDTIASFRKGADDYVTKPFSLQILKVRVEALLRRGAPRSRVLQLGPVTLDFDAYRATRNHEDLDISTREMEILALLHQNLGNPVSRNDILDEVWGMDSTSGTRTVDTYITWIRKKIEPVPSHPRYLISQRGIGYKLIGDG